MNFFKYTLTFYILIFSIFKSYGINEPEQYVPVISFIENNGQLMNSLNQPASEILYYCNSENIGIYICKDKLYYVIKKSKNLLIDKKNEMPDESGNSETLRLELKLLYCNSDIISSAYDAGTMVSNYYLPSCPKGITARSFRKVKLENVYPGIDWVLYFKEESGHTILKYDFEVKPGADFNQIKMQYDGATKISKSARGGIDVETALGIIHDGKPVSYLVNSKQQVKSSFKLSENQIGFEVSGYNKNEKLIIDPTVLWSTYFGYNGDEHGRAVTIGSDGFVYTGGFTNSSNFPLLNGYSSPFHDAFDGWVMKMTPAFQPLWITYYGGSLADVCRTLEVDSAGNVFAGLETRSADMPTFNAYQPAKSDTDDFFIMKLNPSGIPIWASFYGGNSLDAMRRIKLSNLGYLVASGYSKSTNFPMINPIQATNAGDADAVIMKVSMATGFPVWSTYFGGTGYDEPVGITLDNNNNIFVVGTTMSSNFPVQNAFQSVRKGPSDIFVFKFNSNLTVAWSTYIGSTMDDDGSGIALDQSGSCFIIGTSKKNNYPMLNAYQPVYKSPSDAVISKFNNSGGLVWSTYAGGAGTEDGNAIAVDYAGNVLATGFTLSTAFPMVNPTQPVLGGSHDAFILRYTNSGVCLYSTYYGGSGIEHARSIAVDNAGNTFIVGSTTSTNLPLVNPTQSSNGSTANADADAFLLKINYSLSPKPIITIIGNNPKCNASDVVTLSSSNASGNLWSNGATSQSITVSQAGFYLVSSFDSTGVMNTSDTVFIQNNILNNYSLDSSSYINICLDATINLTAQSISGATYSWTGPNGFISSLSNPTINNIQNTSLGIYYCSATVGNCTKPIRIINLVNIINLNPPTNTGYSGPTCQGNQFSIFTDSISEAQFLWSGPNGFSSTSRVVSMSNAQTINAGTYSVKWIFNGCESSSSSVAVIIYTQPTPNAGPDLLACNGNNNVNLDGTTVSEGIGTWTCTTSPHAIIQNPNNATSLATNLKVGTNQFKWTVSNGNCDPVYDLALVKYTTAANFGCIKPSNLNHIVNGNSATLNWSTCTIADQYQIRITLNNVNSNILTTSYTKVLNNLAPGIYTWKVRPKCNGVWSVYSITKTFVIDSSPKYESIEILESKSLVLYPNPVTDQLNISFQIKTTGEYRIEMIDLLGRVLFSETNELEEGSWTENIFTGGLSSGVFFIRITGTDNINLIYKFVKH